MKCIVVANADQQEEILLKNINHNVEMVSVTTLPELAGNNVCDALFLLNECEEIDMHKYSGTPVFINSVIETLYEKNLPDNFSRVNGWPGFLKRSTWEIASHNSAIAGKVFEQLGWDVVFVKDEPGLIAARVISMIVNEAFFALGDGISTKDEIDLAMKLGTNYPYGPFEWGLTIGLQNIYRLLKRLSVTDKRYSVAPLLEKEYAEFFVS